jgi:hypothetical protein
MNLIIQGYFEGHTAVDLGLFLTLCHFTWLALSMDENNRDSIDASLIKPQQRCVSSQCEATGPGTPETMAVKSTS